MVGRPSGSLKMALWSAASGTPNSGAAPWHLSTAAEGWKHLMSQADLIFLIQQPAQMRFRIPYNAGKPCYKARHMATSQNRTL